MGGLIERLSHRLALSIYLLAPLYPSTCAATWSKDSPFLQYIHDNPASSWYSPMCYKPSALLLRPAVGGYWSDPSPGRCLCPGGLPHTWRISRDVWGMQLTCTKEGGSRPVSKAMQRILFLLLRLHRPLRKPSLPLGPHFLLSLTVSLLTQACIWTSCSQ